MKICFCTAVVFISAMGKVPCTDFSQTSNHTSATSKAVVCMAFITFKIRLFDGDQAVILIKCIVVFYCSHGILLLLVGNQVQVGVEDNGYARQNVDASRVLALLDA